MVPGKKTFEKHPCKIFLFFKIVPRPTFLMMLRVFAYVTLVDCTKLPASHLPGIKKLENEIKIQKMIYYYFYFLILKDENRKGEIKN